MTVGHLSLLITAMEDPLGVAQHREKPGAERHPRPLTVGKVKLPLLRASLRAEGHLCILFHNSSHVTWLCNVTY